MADLAMPKDIRALLMAVRDALDVPTAATEEDCTARAAVIDRRVSDTHLLLASLLEHPHNRIGDITEQLLEWTAEHPITYTPFVFTDGIPA